MSKLRGLEKEAADVRYSKTLAYLLRHGAEKQGLPMRQDGYVRVVDIVSGSGDFQRRQGSPFASR